MEILKRFLEWLTLKEKLHSNSQTPPFFKEGEVWWCSLGENIGYEINGKSKLFSRPVLVFRKISRNTFLAIPISTQPQKVRAWYVPVTLNGKENSVILSQVRVIDYRRMWSKFGEISEEDFHLTQRAFARLFVGNNIPPFGGRGVTP
ncbi:MAG: type II toxin-antitoxin system PemK/MazF family toxin [Patescibacteria group bacterium]